MISTYLKKSHSKSRVYAPFKSPLRPKNENEGNPSDPKTVPSRLKSDDSVTSEHGTPVKEDPIEVLVVSTSLPHDPVSEEKDRKLDEAISSLKARICEVQNLSGFTEEDVESEMKRWRDLLHEYNDTRDLCIYVLGQLAQLKMTTVKQLCAEYDLNLDD
ncbi:hypothetical protein Aperf_G00000061920 [Anoplocephala perfoliata]